jgi:hypothetical protein
MSVKRRDLVKYLEENGFYLLREEGIDGFPGPGYPSPKPFDGFVGFSTRGDYYLNEKDAKTMNNSQRYEIMGHEFLENFLRTDYGLYYDEAHGGANILFFGGTGKGDLLEIQPGGGKIMKHFSYFILFFLSIESIFANEYKIGYQLEDISFQTVVQNYCALQNDNKIEILFEIRNNSNFNIYIPTMMDKISSDSISLNSSLLLDFGGSWWQDDAIFVQKQILCIPSRGQDTFYITVKATDRNYRGNGWINSLFTVGEYIITNALIIIDIGVFLDRDDLFKEYNNKRTFILDSHYQRRLSFGLKRFQMLVPIYVNSK